MLKNHKILSFTIALTTSGILVVLGIWLWNSYQNHKVLTLVQADQALMSTLYEYYASKEQPPSNQRSNSQRNLAQEIKSTYPNVEIDSIYAWMDKNATRRQDSLRKKNRDRDRGGRTSMRPNQRPRELNPWFLSNRHVDISPADLDSLSKQYRMELESQGIRKLDYQIVVKKIERNQIPTPEEDRQLQQSNTRPILVNPDEELFIFVELPHSWRYIVSKMAWQILFSLILALALFATFLTLLKTVRKQNKLATLQRTFVNNMTHELKTPLSTVTAAVEAIQRYGARDDKERMYKYLELSKRELEHLTGIVERVLQFNTDEKHGIHLIPQEFDLIKLTDETIESFRLSSKSPVQIELLCSKKQLLVHADEAHIRNVLSNLLDNAIKYNNSPETRVLVTLIEDSNNVTIQVKDNGPGIPKTYQKNIFDMFFRVPQGQLYSVKGFGMGLAYVQQVVHQHGGSISVDSEDGKGATFIINIPKRQP